jgi:ribosomal protein S18 acetylase RimI-like enzyme
MDLPSAGDRDPAPRGGQVTRSAGASRLTAIRYTETDPAAFHAALIRAHDDSLDCPELHAVLTPDDVLAGYRDVAPDPAGWWLAVADDQPAGVLLLNGEELTFLGVVPEWRDKGVGRRMLELALEQAPALSLVVDARNAPAIQLYKSAGLDVVGAREVFLHFPGPAAGTTGPKVGRS